MRIRWRNLELPTRVQIDPTTWRSNYAKFIVEPFERGFGTTVGNSLRRILLSSLEGTAITAVKIKDVAHEFMSVEGIYEDITDVVLNLKKLRVRLHGEGPATITLKKKGKGPVTAESFQNDQTAEIVDPDHYLCEITSEDKEVEIEVTVARGRGYVTADENADTQREIGTIYVDSSFSPVTRVRYHTENTRVGKMTNYDKLTLEVWTDGTITPELAVVEASKILRKHLNPFVQLANPGPELPQDLKHEVEHSAVEKEKDELKRKLAMPISELDLPVRANNCFEAENIRTLGDLCARQESDILKIRNFGKTSLKDVKKKLAEMGLSFGMPRELTQSQ